MWTGERNPETALAILTCVLAAALAYVPARFRISQLWGCWERPLARLARRKTLAIWIAASTPVLLRVLLLPWFPVPAPRFHDEFSFLLGADTLAHGRLANPTHPLWVHFESMHTLMRPRYSTAFPIGQAALLALGQVVVGSPWAGVLAGVGLMCGALCWMLQGFVPARWALLGALLMGLRLGVASYWMNSYWGGCLAAVGGALVIGAWPRIRRTARARAAVILGIGLAILANTRTFEGAVLGATVGAFLFPVFWKEPRRVLLPLAVVLGVTALGMGYYFERVTGKPWVAPYVLYRETMAITPHFLWQQPTAEPLYNNREVREFYTNWEWNAYLSARAHPVKELWNKFETYWRFYLGPLFTIPLLVLPLLWSNRRMRGLLLAGGAFSLALIGQVWHNAHYAAPATGLAILIVMMCLRRLRAWRWQDRTVGLQVVRILPWACAAMLVMKIVAGPPAAGSSEEASWRWPSAVGAKRAKLLRQLEASGGQHLVLVRYTHDHDPGNEWVYNDAAIDASPVVWARELDTASNAKLMRYFEGRRVWLTEPDMQEPVLTLYRDAVPRPMAFVALGAPGIEALRPDEVRRTLGQTDARRSCDQWNALFTQSTGVEGPDVAAGCFEGGDRGRVVNFEQWFQWLQRQR
jgi:hypothetical protein